MAGSNDSECADVDDSIAVSFLTPPRIFNLYWTKRALSCDFLVSSLYFLWIRALD